MGSIRTPPPFRTLLGRRERRGELWGRGPLSSILFIMDREGISRPLCRPGSPLGRAPFRPWRPPSFPTPGAGCPLVRLPICLSLMLTRASRGAPTPAPEGGAGWRGPWLPSHKHWGLVLQQVAAGLGNRGGAGAPFSLRLFILVGQRSPPPPRRLGGIPPGPGSDHTRDGGSSGLRDFQALGRTASQSHPGVPSSLATSLAWCSRLLLWPPPFQPSTLPSPYQPTPRPAPATFISLLFQVFEIRGIWIPVPFLLLGK